jgi:hypothetical protein
LTFGVSIKAGLALRSVTIEVAFVEISPYNLKMGRLICRHRGEQAGSALGRRRAIVSASGD